MTRRLLWSVLLLLPAGAVEAREAARAQGSGWFDDHALYIHLVTNHLPIFGTLMGLLALLLAMIWRSDAARRIALILLLVSTAAAYLVFQAGEHAYEDGRKIADDPGQHWIDEHLA